jgi:hypothetical protein
VSTTAAPQPAHHFPAEFLPPARSESLAFHLPAASAPPAFILNRRESIDAVIQAELAADRNEDDGEDLDDDEEYDDIGPEVYYARQNLPSYLQQRVTALSPACQAAKSRSGPLKQHQATAAPPLQSNNLLPPPPPPPAMHSSDSITRTVSSAATHAQPTLLPQLLAAAPLNSAVCGTARLSGGDVAPLPPAHHHHHHERMVPAPAAAATTGGHHHNQMSGPPLPPPASTFPSGIPENHSNGGHHRSDENSAPAATAAATLSHLMLGQIKVR